MIQPNRNFLLHFQQILMGVIERDKNLKITNWNPAAERIFGYTKNEAVGHLPVDFLVPKNVKNHVMKVWDDLFVKKEASTGINENVTKDGRIIFCEWFNTPVLAEDGTVLTVISLVHDITDKKQMENELIKTKEELESKVMERTAELGKVNKKLKKEIELQKEIRTELQESIRRNKAVLKAIPDILFVLSADGTYIDVISSGDKNLTISPKDIIGKNVRDMGFTRHDLKAMLICFKEVVQTGQMQTLQYELVTSKGLCFYKATLVLIDQDNILASVHDITVQRRTEKAMFDNEKKYRLLKEEADFSNRAKSTFLANMSHELRTPLNAILGFGQLLEIRNGNLTNQQIEFLEHIKHSSNYLLEMVNDILDLSKIEAGKYEIYRKPFNLGQMLLRLPMSINSLAFKKNIELVVDIDLDCETVSADEVRLKQVLYNLLSNAIKFTDTGKRIGIKARTNKNEVVIKVWDEGRGLAQEDLERIFDPFEQVVVVHQKGTGLGLAISRRLIELHGGTLTVTSKMGWGSCFTLQIPGVVSESKKEIINKIMKLPVKKQTMEGKVNILVVEDDFVHQLVTRETLKHLGYHAVCVDTGQKGLKLVLEENFDLILMDIQMHELSGIQSMKQIRKKITKHIPIVAMTAYAMKGDMEKFLSEGFDAYIPKPVVISKLAETLEDLLA